MGGGGSELYKGAIYYVYIQNNERRSRVGVNSYNGHGSENQEGSILSRIVNMITLGPRLWDPGMV